MLLREQDIGQQDLAIARDKAERARQNIAKYYEFLWCSLHVAWRWHRLLFQILISQRWHSLRRTCRLLMLGDQGRTRTVARETPLEKQFDKIDNQLHERWDDQQDKN